jgi:hypothetical protein
VLRRVQLDHEDVQSLGVVVDALHLIHKLLTSITMNIVKKALPMKRVIRM